MTPFALIDSRELLERASSDATARLKVIRREAIDVDFDRRRCAARGASGISALRPLPRAGRFSMADTVQHEAHEARQISGSLCVLRGLGSVRRRHAAVAAERSSTSRASARYASAPRDFTS